ncbi:hypothetical protein [Methylomonas koyamae]|uniref:hypothetical protein n=1 Tax=Methylomonas koyamae TaxID=702114 RepID=UPI000AC638BA|nr:hypothetical protein [Methylomonas koyamae]ATG91234.1 hypothetical protein MKLM6_3035 [Methylomonas koyamae]WNB77225.1 hypothetical protein RI210_06535 [Methylomonas koyamae]
MSDANNTLPEHSEQSTENVAVDKSRRTFAKAGVVAPVIMTLANRSAWGGGKRSCGTISGFQSYAKAGNVDPSGTGTYVPPKPNPPSHYCGPGTAGNWPVSKPIKCRPFTKYHENNTGLEGGYCLRDRAVSDAVPAKSSSRKGKWKTRDYWVTTEGESTEYEYNKVAQYKHSAVRQLENATTFITLEYARNNGVPDDRSLHDCIKELNAGSYTRDNCFAWLFVNACDDKNFIGTTPADVRRCYSDYDEETVIQFCKHLISNC